MSLDWDDDEMRSYYSRVCEDNDLRLHEFAVEHPAAAAQCVHKTFQMTIEFLFNCAPSANHRPEKQRADGFPCKCEPGIFGYIAGYLGVVEPQMRWTEHIHMLVQLLGFAHPKDFFHSGDFIDTFRKVWCFVASIVFESQEGFAAYLGTSAALRALQQSPLIELRSQQQTMIGSECVDECIAAQLKGRGLKQTDNVPIIVQEFQKWPPKHYADPTVFWVNLLMERWILKLFDN